jgi:hypothetical protein
MTRFLSFVIAIAVALALTSTASAQQKQKKKKKGGAEVTAGGTVAGTIKSVSDDGKTLTVEAPGKKKAPGATHDVKVTDKTKVEFLGIDSKDEQKLLVGYAVTITLEDGSKDTAGSMQVSKASVTTPKKKKKKDK